MLPIASWQQFLQSYETQLSETSAMTLELFYRLFPTPRHAALIFTFIQPKEQDEILLPIYERLIDLLTKQLAPLPITVLIPDQLEEATLLITYDETPWIVLNLIDHTLYACAPEIMILHQDAYNEILEAKASHDALCRDLKTTKYPWIIDDSTDWSEKLSITRSKKKQREYFETLDTERLRINQLERELKRDAVQIQQTFKAFLDHQAYWVSRFKELMQYAEISEPQTPESEENEVLQMMRTPMNPQEPITVRDRVVKTQATTEGDKNPDSQPHPRRDLKPLPSFDLNEDADDDDDDFLVFD